MSVNAAIFARRAGTDRKRERFQYPLLRANQYVLQLLKIESFQDMKYGKELYNWMRVKFLFVVLVKGWEKARTKEEQDRFRNRGHGMFLSIEVHPSVAAPGRNSKGEKTLPSNLYELLRVMLFDGEPLTKAQMGILDPKDKGDLEKLDAYVREFNASADEHNKTAAKDEQIAHINRETGLVYYAAERTQAMLNELEATKPIVYGMVEQKLKKDNVTKYNKLTKVVSLVMDDDEQRPEAYKPYGKPYDSREDEDDPDLSCEECGQHIRGYEMRKDGSWVSNTKAAEGSREKWGKALCGSCAWKHKQEELEAPFDADDDE